jgi:general stress protein 26
MENRAQYEQSVKKLAELIKGIEITMLTTNDPDGCLRSRPMATQNEEFDGTLWFFTSRESGKVHSIENEQEVNLSYASPKDHRYVSVTGTASIVENKIIAKEFWTPMLRAWFPEGVDDPNLILIKVQVESAEYWDYKSSKMVSLVGFARSIFSKQPYKDDREHHDRLSLR